MHTMKNNSIKRILIVDDNDSNLFAMSAILSALGVSVITAKNGKIGIDILLEDDSIDLVFMDIMMPVMDGYQAITEIRTIHHLTTPIIALTAKAMAGDMEKCMSAGANDYCAKPVQIDDIRDKVRSYT